MVKQPSEFRPHKQTRDRLQPSCRVCDNRRSNAYNKAHRHQTINAHLRRTFGISLEDYNTILERQHGCCAICHRPPTKTRLAVDHCHVTNKVRGLLCFTCNVALGKFQDSPDRLRAAALYLETNG